MGMDRNALPLPVDGRLDLRANRTFAWPRRRPALFAEVINVLDEDNVRFSPADQQPDAASDAAVRLAGASCAFRRNPRRVSAVS